MAYQASDETELFIKFLFIFEIIVCIRPFHTLRNSENCVEKKETINIQDKIGKKRIIRF